MSIVEVISCGKCGAQFAACVDGWQDKDWNKQRSVYLKFGQKVEFLESEDLDLQNCEHPKDKEHMEEIALQNQLKLF